MIEIEPLDTYAGKLPSVQRKKVIEWAEDRKEFLFENFKRLNPRI